MAVKKEALEKEKIAEVNITPKTTKKIATGSTKKMVQKRSSSLAGKKEIKKQNTQKSAKNIEKEESNGFEPKKIVKPVKKKEKTPTKEKKEIEKKDIVKKETAKKEENENKKQDVKKENRINRTQKKDNKESIPKNTVYIENEKSNEKQIKEDVKKEIVDDKIDEERKETKQLSLKEMAEMQEVIAKEIKANKKLPEIEFQKMSTRIFQNICLAVTIMCYLNFVILGFINIENSIFITDLKVFSIVILAIAIGIIEHAYKKESGRHVFHGIEMLILSFITIGLIYLNLMIPDKFIVIAVLITYVFSIYYILKTILIFRKMKKKYFIENMREIIRK